VIVETIAGIVGLSLLLTEHKTKPKPRWVVELHPAILSDSITKLLDRGFIVGRYLDRRTATHLHRGIDISAPRFTNIYSIQDGKVIGTYPDGERQGYGNSILILNSDGFSSFYTHLESINPEITRGAYVYKGQLLGKVGYSGTRHKKPHLHLEIIKNLTFRNPKPPINENTPRIDPIDYLVRNNVTIGRT
jgi:murein DD-endopeptidase MepM/ murein hydrolase activator NlpD